MNSKIDPRGAFVRYFVFINSPLPHKEEPFISSLILLMKKLVKKEEVAQRGLVFFQESFNFEILSLEDGNMGSHIYMQEIRGCRMSL